MRYIELKGSFYEMGLQQGKAFAGEIRALFQKFCGQDTWIWKTCGLSYSDVDRIRDRLLRRTSEYAPDVVEEMRGIADGAQMRFEDVQLLNFLGDIGLIKPQCSVVIFTEGTDGPILGKNNDLHVEEGNPSLLKKITPPKGYSYLTFCWVGTAWACDGMNEAGLCFGGTSGPCRKEPFKLEESVSTYSLMRNIFQNCSRVSDGIERLSRCKIFGKNGLNYGLVDHSGQASIIEKCGYEQEVRRTEGHHLFCTDSFSSPGLKGISIPRGKKADKNSGNRNKNLASLLAGMKTRTIEDMKAILENHHQPGEICQHGKDGYLKTVCSMIMLPRAKTFLMTGDNPCKGEYASYQL